MARYELILPEGSVLLRNPETGESFRLTAESGPIRLGEVDFSVTLAGFGPEGLRAAVPAEAPRPQAACRPLIGSAFALPPGFGPETELPFLSPLEPMAPEASASRSAPHVRVLEAPLEALTEEEFERTLGVLVAARDESERELEFLREIEADPIDIEDLEEAARALDERFRKVSERFDAWRALQREVDRSRG